MGANKPVQRAVGTGGGAAGGAANGSGGAVYAGGTPGFYEGGANTGPALESNVGIWDALDGLGGFGADVLDRLGNFAGGVLDSAGGIVDRFGRVIGGAMPGDAGNAPVTGYDPGLTPPPYTLGGAERIPDLTPAPIPYGQEPGGGFDFGQFVEGNKTLLLAGGALAVFYFATKRR